MTPRQRPAGARARRLEDEYGRRPPGQSRYDAHGRPPGRRWGYSASGWRFGLDSEPDNWSDSTTRATEGGRGAVADRIHQEVYARLTSDSRVNAAHIRVQVQKGHVTLTGTVTSPEQKRRAEDVADCISGVKEVTNNIRVSYDDEPASPAANEADDGERVAAPSSSQHRLG